MIKNKYLYIYFAILFVILISLFAVVSALIFQSCSIFDVWADSRFTDYTSVFYSAASQLTFRIQRSANEEVISGTPFNALSIDSSGNPCVVTMYSYPLKSYNSYTITGMFFKSSLCVFCSRGISSSDSSLMYGFVTCDGVSGSVSSHPSYCVQVSGLASSINVNYYFNLVDSSLRSYYGGSSFNDGDSFIFDQVRHSICNYSDVDPSMIYTMCCPIDENSFFSFNGSKYPFLFVQSSLTSSAYSLPSSITICSLSSSVSFSDIANVDYSYSLDGSNWTAADGKSFEFEESNLPMDIYLRPDSVSDMYTFITFTSTSGKLSHTDYSNIWKYTISSLEDVTISGDAQKHKLLTVAESSEYTFEFKVLGDSVIPDTEWISNTDGVDHSFPFLGNFNMLIRNVSISYGLLLSSFQMSSSGNLLYTQDNEGVYTLLAEDSGFLNDLTTIYIQTAPFSLRAYPLFTFAESDDFNGYPILSSMKSENLAVEISSFPWSPEDMTGVILEQYNLLLFSYDIPYWVFEDGSMCTFPLELDEAVQHTSIKPYVSSIRYNPYSMLDMNSSIRAYLVYRDMVNNPPDSLTLSQAMELIDTYSFVALRSPLYYTDPEYVYLCFNSSFLNPYFDISFNGSVICSKQIYSYAYSTSTTYLYYYPLQSLIEASTELFGSTSRAKEKLLTLNYISIDTEDGISGDEIHIVLHFDESNIWNPDMLDAFYFFSTIFKGVISALDVYIAPNMTLLSVFTVVLAFGVLFFVFKIAGIF